MVTWSDPSRYQFRSSRAYPDDGHVSLLCSRVVRMHYIQYGCHRGMALIGCSFFYLRVARPCVVGSCVDQWSQNVDASGPHQLPSWMQYMQRWRNGVSTVSTLARIVWLPLPPSFTFGFPRFLGSASAFSEARSGIFFLWLCYFLVLKQFQLFQIFGSAWALSFRVKSRIAEHARF